MSVEIVVSTGEMNVVIPANRSRQTMVFGVIGLFFLGWEGLKLVKVAETSLHTFTQTQSGVQGWLFGLALVCLPVAGILLLLWMALQVLRPLFGSQQTIRCTRAELQLTSIDFGRTWQRRSFAQEDVRSLTFGAVSVSKYGAVNGLRFQVHKKQVKTLRGLKAAEGQQILGELRRLGFDVLIDPAMKMIIEIEQSRDRSFF